MKQLFKKSLIPLLFGFAFLLLFSSIGSIQEVEAAVVSNTTYANGSNPLYLSGPGNVTITAKPSKNATSCTITGGGLSNKRTGSFSSGSPIEMAVDVYVLSDTTFTVTCEYTPPPINGVCDNTAQNSCSAGIPNDGAIADTSTYYKWRCDGENGGTDSGTCQIAKPTYSCTGTYEIPTKIDYTLNDFEWKTNTLYYSGTTGISPTGASTGQCRIYQIGVSGYSSWIYDQYEYDAYAFDGGSGASGYDPTCGYTVNRSPTAKNISDGSGYRYTSASCSTAIDQTGNLLDEQTCTTDQYYSGCSWTLQ